MAFRLPEFVNNADLWRPPNEPPDTPDRSDMECQLYITSRGQFDFAIEDVLTYSPPIYIRFPKGTDVRPGDILEVNAETGWYYVVRYVERMHLDFPNEYLVAISAQVATPIPPPPAASMITEDGDPIITEDGDPIVEE